MLGEISREDELKKVIGLSQEEFDALDRWSAENRTPMAEIVRRAVRLYLHITPASQS